MLYDYMIDPLEKVENAKAYETMLNHAKEMFLSRPLEEIVKKASVTLDDQKKQLIFNSFGQKIAVSYPDARVVFFGTDKKPARFWVLLILHYLSIADGTPLRGELVNFRLLKDGAIRGGNFDRDCGKALSSIFSDTAIKEIENICVALGADIIHTTADVSAVFHLFPQYPMTMKYWLADDELPGTGQLLIDAMADHYLSLEDSVTLGSMLLDFLIFQQRIFFNE